MRKEKQPDKNKDSGLSLKNLSWTFTMGAMSRWAELPVGHVLNRIRVWYNTNPNERRAIANIARGGLRNFYKGINWSVIPATLRTGGRWVTVRLSDSATSLVIPNEYKTLRAFSIGVLSPAITTSLFCPFERIKTLVITSDHKFSLRQHFKLKGVLDLWTGARPIFLKTGVISVAFNVSYTNVMSLFYRYKQDRVLNTIDLAMISALSGMICAAITTPIDMLKDQMQQKKGLSEVGIFRGTRAVYQRYGLFSMYRTAPLKMVRSAWYFAVTTVVMHKMKALPPFMQPESQEEKSFTR